MRSMPLITIHRCGKITASKVNCCPCRLSVESASTVATGAAWPLGTAMLTPHEIDVGTCWNHIDESIGSRVILPPPPPVVLPADAQRFLGLFSHFRVVPVVQWKA